MIERILEIRPTEVATGIYRLSVPVPFIGLGQVNIWLLEDDEGFAMIDCGVSNSETRRVIEDAWAYLFPRRSLTRFIVTHFHPDHVGNAGFVSSRWNVRPQMTLMEWMAANVAQSGLYSDDVELRTSFFRQNGASAEQLSRFLAETHLYHSNVSLPDSFDRIRAGDSLSIGWRCWTVLTGRGHSPDLVMLYSSTDDILIAGDQLLPKITPNISVWPWEPLADPLSEFLESLQRLAEITTSRTLVLPSHRDPFEDAPSRVHEIVGHHANRLVQVRSLLDEGPSTAAAMLGSLFRPNLDGHQFSFAMGEALAHLNHLTFKGLVNRRAGFDGTISYSLS
ncbi:MBL fold metallo-hydrolase [Brucella thiophenivorans]|uniref:Metallo-beta-lactamase superfamily protein n=1 Tax=Brucella thiophenivorans TaxID=571255 RepID=A0A256G8Q6_9HYPH|nr:MBL fold metallo-hydrolase [Brucella thiophenivorans]OYR23326.1 metallo-beta-lactamase superfamily protein [Brucella thiophenivorans]